MDDTTAAARRSSVTERPLYSRIDITVQCPVERTSFVLLLQPVVYWGYRTMSLSTNTRFIATMIVLYFKHWLSIDARVQYKPCLRVHLAIIIGKAPDYVQCRTCCILFILAGLSSRRKVLRSASNEHLYVHSTHETQVQWVSVQCQLHEHGTVSCRHSLHQQHHVHYL